MLAGVDAEQGHAHGLTSGDANLVGGEPDQSAGVGDQHDVVAGMHRKGRDHRFSVTRRQRDIGDALATAVAMFCYLAAIFSLGVRA